MHPGGYLVAVDAQNNALVELTMTDTVLPRWGSRRAGSGEFDGPQGVAVDSSGIIYVRIGVTTGSSGFNAAGAPPGQIMLPGHPTRAAVDLADALYLTFQPASYVAKVTPDGEPLRQKRID